MTDIDSLVAYLIDQTKERGGDPIKTAIVKLVYLIDVEHYRRYGKTVTGFTWRFYHYGPYTAEIETAFKGLGIDLSETEFRGQRQGRPTRGYRYGVIGDWRGIERRFHSAFDNPVKRSVGLVLDRWAAEPLWNLLDHVYFETEPMIGANRGDVLDFSTIARQRVTAPQAAQIQIPKENLEDLRQRYQTQRAKEKSARPLRQPSPPVYDELYAAACSDLDEDDRQFVVPPGTSVSDSLS